LAYEACSVLIFFGVLYDRIYIRAHGIFVVAAVLVVPAWLGLLAFVPNVRTAVGSAAVPARIVLLRSE
jgi:hypothetical protein